MSVNAFDDLQDLVSRLKAASAIESPEIARQLSAAFDKALLRDVVEVDSISSTAQAQIESMVRATAPFPYQGHIESLRHVEEALEQIRSNSAEALEKIQNDRSISSAYQGHVAALLHAETALEQSQPNWAKVFETTQNEEALKRLQSNWTEALESIQNAPNGYQEHLAALRQAGETFRQQAEGVTEIVETFRSDPLSESVQEFLRVQQQLEALAAGIQATARVEPFAAAQDRVEFMKEVVRMEQEMVLKLSNQLDDDPREGLG